MKDYWLAVVVEGYKVTSKATEVLGTRLQNGQEYIIIQWLTETGTLRNVILTKGRASSLTVPRTLMFKYPPVIGETDAGNKRFEAVSFNKPVSVLWEQGSIVPVKVGSIKGGASQRRVFL